MVLFRGSHIMTTDLPWSYIPLLFALQLTIPTVVLFLIGLPSLVLAVYRKANGSAILVTLALWLGVPTLVVILLGVEIAGIRHMLFLAPPVIAIGGVGLGFVARRIRTAPLAIGLVCLVLLPGILSIRSMHPYEYVYYNEFVGGPGGADGQFDMDFWCTSHREMMEYVNVRAAHEAVVVAWGPYWAAGEFARPDLKVRPGSTKGPDYYLSCWWGLEFSPFAR